MSEVRIIGGVFGLPESAAGCGPLPELDDPRTSLLVNGRSAIDLILRRADATRIWLPSFICGSVVEAAGAREIAWYDVADMLVPRDEVWLGDVRPGDVALFVNYFGWRGCAAWYDRAAARGAIVVEDGSQSLLTSGRGQDAHFSFTVPRKFVGVPDGALLIAPSAEAFGQVPLAQPAEDWWRTAYAANAGRREFDRGGGDRAWFAAFSAAEAAQPLGPIAMSDSSEALLRNGFDFDAIAQRRRANYSTLA